MSTRALVVAAILLLLPQFVLAGSQTYSTPGTSTFTVPSYSTLTVQVWGAGGGGGGGGWGTSSFGGGGGGYSTHTYSSGQVSGTVTVTVGAGGAGGATDAYVSGYAYGQGYAGSAGGGSSFGAYVTAGGGGGGGPDAFWNAGGSWPGPSGPVGSGGTGTTETGGTGGGAVVTGQSCDDEGYCSNVYTLLPGASATCAGGGGGGDRADWEYMAYTCVTDSAGGTSGCGGRGGDAANAQYWCSIAGQAGTGPGGGGGAGNGPVSYYQSQVYAATAGSAGAPGQVTITWTDPPNSAPTAPTITGTTTPIMSTSYAYTFQSTDPDSDTLRYAVDWDNNSSIDEYVPALGYVNSGTATSTTHSWSSSGSKTFQAKAIDSNGNASGWTSYTVTVANPAPVVLLTASPSSITSGQSSTLTWSSSYATSCTGTNFSTATNTSGSTTTAPTVTTTYTATCTGSGGTGSNAKTVTVSCTPTTSYSCSNSTTLASTTVTSACVTTTTNTTCSYQCATNACIAPPPPTFNAGTTTNGHLQVAPSLIPSGSTTHVYWDISDTSSCSITGTNGDSWTGGSSGANGQISRAIIHQTTFTLSCTGLDASTIHETAVVNILPVFQEL